MSSFSFDYSPIPAGATYSSQLRKFAAQQPDKPAYIFFDAHFNKTTLTRKDVWDKSRKFAAILRRNGVRKRDVVCNTLVNSPERLLSTFGICLAGGVSMHGQAFLSDGEDLIHTCKVAKCSSIIVDPGQAKAALEILNKIQYKDEQSGETLYRGLPDLKTVIHFRTCTNSDEEASKRGLFFLEEENEMFVEQDVTEDDDAIIFCTSGTTGFSKLVPSSHRRALHVGRSLADLCGIGGENAIFFNVNSLGWLGGFPGAYPTFGCTRVLIDMSRGVPEKAEHFTMKILNEVKFDGAFIVPVMIKKIIGLVRSGIKMNHRATTIATGGSPIGRDVLDAIGLICDSLTTFYGMTECGLVSSKRYDEETLPKGNCAGKTLEGCEITILDEKLLELPTGKVGQIAIRGPLTMEGYVNNPEETKGCFTKDGFLLSGDSGYKGDDAEIFVLGRQADF